MLTHGPATDRTPSARSRAGRRAAPSPIRRRSRRRRRRSASTENQGELKAATWRAAAAAEAGRAAPACAIAIRKARKSTTVAGALRLALLTGRITPATARAGSRRDYADARRAGAAAHRRARRSRSRSVLGDRRLARRRHLLDAEPPAPRLPRPAPQHRSSGRTPRSPPPSQRITFGKRPRGLPVLPRPRACSSSRWPAGARRTGSPASACACARRRAAAPPARWRELRRTRSTRLLALARRSAATSSPGSTTSAGAAGRRRGSAA